MYQGRNTDTYTMTSGWNRFLIGILLALIITGFGFSEETIHVIRQGETIYSIAKSYGLSAQEVMTYNKISDPRTIQVGTKIRIPGTNGQSAPSSTLSQPNRNSYDEYRVQKNDTLYGLAKRYGINIADLLDLNGFAPNYVIKIGEIIRVPALGNGSTQSGQTGIPSGGTSSGTEGSGTAVPSPNSGNLGTTVTVIKVDPSIKWPIKAKEISQITGKLNGVQLTGERQESVKSLTPGTVVSAGPYRGFGKVAIVQTTTGYIYVYGGCETLAVKEGDKVASGTELGKLGIDTKTAKSQLFFFVYKGNTPIDPSKAPRI